MKLASALAAAILAAAPLLAAPLPKPLVSGLKNPESVVVGPDGKIFVTVIGEFGKDGDGAVMVIEDGKALPFAEGLDDPKGIAVFQRWLFVADKNRIWRIDEKGKADVYVPASAFPTPPIFLDDVAVDPESGILYVSNLGDLQGKGGAVYRIPPQAIPKGSKGTARAPMADKVSLVVDSKKLPAINIPKGLAMDGASFLLLVDSGTGALYRIKVADGSSEKLADGFGFAGGLVWDRFGRLFVSDHQTGKIYAIPRPGEKPVLMAEGFQTAPDIGLDASGENLLVPDMKAGTVTVLPIQIPGWEVEHSPLPLKTEVAFPNLKWAGWQPETDAGIPSALRPLLLTHAGDGSNRVFVGTEHGVIHVFPNDQQAAETKVFLDIQDRVSYNDKQNEEGFLGLAFHPKFKENGEFFVFYTTKKAKLTNVISRFKVSKDDPNKADPSSEEILLTIEKPYWNHDGGTLCFGPDGFLYFAHGDGGLGNDPHENGQKLSTLLGKISRIDVDHKEMGKNYAIPRDNPFVGVKDARPEIWAYGLRNVWRMAFDRKSGRLWSSDVGQNLFEEIDLIEKGGNFGWSFREALHPFGAKGVGPRKDLIEPIWEYNHDVGKSLTGGAVYRGKRLPELDGCYLYGDYVTMKIWALTYDDQKKRVVANRPIKDPGVPIMSFGEDEQGEAYFMTFTLTGKGIYRFTK